MKMLKCVAVLLAFGGLMLVGCSDETQSPVGSTEQSSLEKAIITNFTFYNFPIAPPTGGTITLTPGGIWQVKKIEVLERFTSSDPVADGIMKHYLSLSIDAVTGEGPCHGSWTITPTNPTSTGGGVWEGKYEGYRSKSVVPGEWTLPLKVEGHGKGGSIQGMQVFANAVLTVRADGPTTLPTSWTGIGEGFYKSH
jgi:hypothetical protein